MVQIIKDSCRKNWQRNKKSLELHNEEKSGGLITEVLSWNEEASIC